MTFQNQLEIAASMKVVLLVAPQKKLYTLLTKLSKPLKHARVLGVIGEDSVESELLSNAHKGPVLVGVPDASLDAIRTYQGIFEKPTAV